MDMISSTTSNTTATSAEQNKQESSMVASSPPSEEAAAARDSNANQLAWQQQVLLASGGGGERKPRPQQEQGLTCPRCNSTNTKFCYYNNNSMTQPRYFCKGCRRNWTQGGILRNIPVRAPSRKNKQLNRAGGSSAAAAAVAPPAAPSSSSNDSKMKMNLTQQLSMMPTATAPMPADFPNVLPAFMLMGGGFELPSSDHHSLPFPPLSPLFNPGTEPSFLDTLTEVFLDSGNNGMTAPPLFGTSDQHMVGLLQDVDQALDLPMAAPGGSGLQQWPSLAAHDQQVVADDGSADKNNKINSSSSTTTTTTTNNNNAGGGASGGSSSDI